MSQPSSNIALVAPLSVPGEVDRRLAAAADQRDHPMRLVVAATVAVDGMPNARTLVVRGVDDRFDRLWFHTDVRAAKVRELQRHPGMCLVAYDPRDGVQITLRGRAVVRTDDAVADRHWEQLDIATRHLYRREHEPVTRPIAEGTDLVAETDPRTRAAIGRMEESVDDTAARRHFAVLEFTVESVDWFQSTRSGMRRVLLSREGGWQPVEVAI